MEKRALKIILEQGRIYVDKLLKLLLESGFDTVAVPIIFIGGDSKIIKENMGDNVQ